MNNETEPPARQPISFDLHLPVATTELQALAMDHAANPMFLARRSGQICWVNQAFVQLYGFSSEEVLGKTPRILKSGRQNSDFYKDLWATIGKGMIWRGQLSNRKKTGELFDVEQTITPIKNAAERVTHFLAVYEDITQRLRSEQNIAKLALFDSLTGLPNRNQFLRRVSEAASRTRRSGKTFGVMLGDLDHFKAVNDMLGHAAGDDLLIQVARRMSACTRDSDIVSRLSGDEFAILLDDLARPEQAVETAQRILDAIREPFEVFGHPVHVGVSIGITISETDSSPESMLHNADLAMYQAKARGRCQYQFFDSAMDAAARRRYAMESDLRSALREDRLQLVYQPQVNMQTNRVVGAEALLRWTDPVRGPVPPQEFVALAEQTGMIFALNDWVLRRAVKQIAAWKAAGTAQVPISVNISAGQFDRVGYADSVRTLLESEQVSPPMLRFEITESVILKPSLTVHDNLQKLSRLGIQIAIDDFGTGYSSLPSLRDFPINCIKMDASYVRGIGKSTKDEQLLRALIGVGHNLKLRLIAEGIERPDQSAFLLKEQCCEGQGFLYSKGLPAEDFLGFISRPGFLSQPVAA